MLKVLKKAGIIFLHIIFWGFILIVPQYLIYIRNSEIPRDITTYLLISAIFVPLVFYTFFYFIVPLTIKNRIKRIYTVLIYVLSGLTFLILKYFVLFVVDWLSPLDFAKHNLYAFPQQFAEAFNIFFFIVMAILLKIALYWRKDEKNKTELALREHQLELELLKAQINPHFFFNTLNNIYSLVYKKSSDAPAAVMKLSEIMRYLIYESKSEMVALDKEMEQLENYIELEKLRIKTPDFIDFQVMGETNSQIIPPMLLITFVENAFKHGKKNIPAPGISIKLYTSFDSVKFSVENYIITENKEPLREEGIGIHNTRRRLELLYPGKHKLDIFQQGGIHRVSLILYNKKTN